MKKLNFNFLVAITFLLSLALLTSCGDDGCTQEDFEGTFIGKYAVIGIQLPNPDTVVITSLGDNKIRLKSSLLRTSFEADYDNNSGEYNLESLNIDTLSIGSEFFAGIFVSDVDVLLDGSCDNLYIYLNKASVDTGTVDISVIGANYPLQNISLTTSGNGLKRQ